MSEKSANISKIGLQKNSKDNYILGKVMKFQINSLYGSKIIANFQQGQGGGTNGHTHSPLSSLDRVNE